MTESCNAASSSAPMSQEVLLAEDLAMCRFLYDPQESFVANPRIACSLNSLFNPRLAGLIQLPGETYPFEHITTKTKMVLPFDVMDERWKGMQAIAQKGLKVTHIDNDHVNSVFVEPVENPDYEKVRPWEPSFFVRYKPIVIQLEYLFGRRSGPSPHLTFKEYINKPYFLRHCVSNSSRHHSSFCHAFELGFIKSSVDGEFPYTRVTLQFYTRAAQAGLDACIEQHEHRVRQYEQKREVYCVPTIRSLEGVDQLLLQHSRNSEHFTTRQVLGSSDMRGEILKFLECKGKCNNHVCIGNCDSFIQTSNAGLLGLHLTRNGIMYLRDVRRYTNLSRTIEYDPTPHWREFFERFVAPGKKGSFSFVSNKRRVMDDIHGEQLPDLEQDPYVFCKNRNLEYALIVAQQGNWSYVDIRMPAAMGVFIKACKNIQWIPFLQKTEVIEITQTSISQAYCIVRFSGMLDNVKPPQLKLTRMPELDLSPI